MKIYSSKWFLVLPICFSNTFWQMAKKSSKEIESTQGELSNEYEYSKVSMIFTIFCVLVPVTKIASGLINWYFVYAEQPLNNTATLAEQKAQWYYQSCLDVNKSREDLGAQPMLELISTLGGWSVSNSSGYFDLEKFDFQKAIESLHSYDPNTLFLFWVGEDEKNSSTNVLHVGRIITLFLRFCWK